MSFDVAEFRKGFPQLERTQGPNPLVYFDSGASTLKHSLVAERVNRFNRFETSNVHRGAHSVSRMGTESYEQARSKVKNFISARHEREIIFTRGTTEGINLVASGFRSRLEPGDEILISPFEHHSNIVPWQILCEQTGARLVVAPFDPKEGMTLEGFIGCLSPKTKLAAFIFHSNSFGIRLPVEAMIQACRDQDTLTLLDAAQSMISERVNVQHLNCDFLVFSGHKIFAPYGIGALYMRSEIERDFPVYQSGGSMIDRVSFEKTTYAEAPQKYEAGTPNISGAIGLGVAVDILEKMNFPEQHQHVLALRHQLLTNLEQREKVEVYDFPATDFSGVVSFNLTGAHPSDVGALLDKYGFAVRAGHHCTQPLMDLMGLPGTVRVSLGPYNSTQEIDAFLKTLQKVEEFF